MGKCPGIGEFPLCVESISAAVLCWPCTGAGRNKLEMRRLGSVKRIKSIHLPRALKILQVVSIHPEDLEAET